MLNLKVLQAEEGDCFILEYGKATKPKYILIDGGPKDIYDMHLRDELKKISDNGGKLRLVILSHACNDHVLGLLDMITELRQQKANGEKETITVDSLWHNSFSQTIGDNTEIESRLKTLLTMNTSAPQTIAIAGFTIQGIKEGHQLRLAALSHGIPINPESPTRIISQEVMDTELISDNLILHVISPTKENIKILQQEWLKWLESKEQGAETIDPFFSSMSDDNFKNLSSIIVLIEGEGKKILFTGDGRGDHILLDLKKAGLLDADNKLHVNVLKVPHHGSDRNVTKDFFRTITADTYIISGNGKHGNPDLATLIWIVEAAREQERPIKIILTNETLSSKALKDNYPPVDYRYTLEQIKNGDHSIIVEIAP